jgi:hypothetical protein
MSRAGDPNGLLLFPRTELLRAVLDYGSADQGAAPLKGTLNFNPMARAHVEALLGRQNSQWMKAAGKFVRKLAEMP